MPRLSLSVKLILSFVCLGLVPSAVGWYFLSNGIHSIESLDQLKSFQQTFSQSKWYLIGGVVIFFGAASYYIRNQVTKVVGDLRQVRQLSAQFVSSGDDIKQAADVGLSVTNQQASFIQETVATLNEITAMVNRSVEYASKSTERAEGTHRIASEGKGVVTQMTSAMDEINLSNNDIMTQINKSNQEISKIVDVIHEISSKTTVINDIVFQTKLLSFNASVEAARAGEHGKGFAVVAEEIGNLAAMSGQAATEISAMLADSSHQVEAVVKDTSSSIGRLIEVGKSKVESGVEIANRCEQVFDEVVANVGEVTTMMSEISAGSREQADGVSNITQAMTELDSATHENSDAANRSMEAAHQVAQRAKSLESLVGRVLARLTAAEKVGSVDDGFAVDEGVVSDDSHHSPSTSSESQPFHVSEHHSGWDDEGTADNVIPMHEAKEDFEEHEFESKVEAESSAGAESTFELKQETPSADAFDESEDMASEDKVAGGSDLGAVPAESDPRFEDI